MLVDFDRGQRERGIAHSFEGQLREEYVQIEIYVQKDFQSKNWRGSMREGVEVRLEEDDKSWTPIKPTRAFPSIEL